MQVQISFAADLENGTDVMLNVMTSDENQILRKELYDNFDKEEAGNSKLLHSPIRKLSKFYQKAKKES